MAIINGTNGNDVLDGTEFDDEINGLDGDDILNGRRGTDVLNGGAGDDVLDGGTGADVLNGSLGIDTASYQGSLAGVTVKLWNNTGSGGDAEGDTFFSIENLIGSAQNDILQGNSGDNLLDGGAGDDKLVGGRGDDILTGGEGADALDGGAGIDTASYADSTVDHVIIDLSTGTAFDGDAEGDTFNSIENLVGTQLFSDELTGDSGVNQLFGLGGTDRLEGGAGADTLDGGADQDFASYANSPSAVTINLLAGTASGGDATGDTLISIESLWGSNFADSLTGDNGNNSLVGDGGDDVLKGGAGDDNLSGRDGNDILEGGAGDDSLSGGDGNDLLIGGPGRDFLRGGAGIDTASYAASPAAVTIRLWEDNFGIKAEGGDAEGDQYPRVHGIEIVIGSDHNDVLQGNKFDNRLEGGAGDDRLSGVGGNNILIGGAGADVLKGSVGIDTASYEGSSAGVTVKLWERTATGGDAAGDTFRSIENLIGSDNDDVLQGNSADNRIDGGAGDDRLSGGRGDDILIGGAGADVLKGSDGIDTASYEGSSAGVTVKLWNHSASGGDAQGDTLRSIEKLTGSDHNDVLQGNAANNFLDGGAGDDSLFGGRGNDTFVFSGTWGDDTIKDFTDGVDLLDLSGTGLTFGDLTINQSGGDTLIEDAFGNSITLTGITASDITADDFLF